MKSFKSVRFDWLVERLWKDLLDIICICRHTIQIFFGGNANDYS